MLDLQDRVHRSDECEVVSNGLHNSGKNMPTSSITSILVGHWALGNSTLSYGEMINGLCSEDIEVKTY